VLCVIAFQKNSSKLSGGFIHSLLKNKKDDAMMSFENDPQMCKIKPFCLLFSTGM